ncbi:pantothenate kinase [Aspergillus vadensis CBS 113365]|uniref:Pantothenate kinase n=2 Tax=Aspergillus subgen. Circumdati TaxID=2720871 RepID=A0A317V7R8_ASPEC|nr:pantothenate kinase [Aspergillus eucalypticola CBS 122712]XP_025562647.1 pantothenate kinase [Aspergillus vadensis CBS 113365]PWY68160.1 pantothenate kinase [Aspergillus eucalypticola CBS 122712]PYH68853.1 pantothenate kinase [Aspergillus vadensis CBS 113365]
MSSSTSNSAARGGRLEQAITNPGSVKINVKGAFIVDDDPRSKSPVRTDGVHYEGHDIRLPHHTGLVSHVAVDIGGSLAKLVYFTRELDSVDNGGRLNFINFETSRIDLCIDFIKQLKEEHEKLGGPSGDALCVMATGGGAFKYYDKLKEALNVDIIREDEMECLITGLDFFITEIPNEVFTYSETEPMQFAEARPDVYPYLLVNIGSGVSMIKVSGPKQFQRVGGTHLGGGTFWGIMSLLTGARTFDDMLAMADRGDNSGVDMLVGDIYGMDYSKIGLKNTAIASTFGKVFRMKNQTEPNDLDGESSSNGEAGRTNGEPKFQHEDMSRSLLYAISNNIGQIAYLQSEKHQVKHIYFGGSFIRGHRQTMNTLSYAIKFWSKGEKQAYFLRHEGYIGAVGVFLRRQPANWGRRNSIDEKTMPQVAKLVAEAQQNSDSQNQS